MRKIFAALLALVVLGLGGCNTGGSQYVPPDLPASSAAIITGSKIPKPGLLAEETRVYLVSVDGKRTGEGPGGWDDRTVVAPGPHVIGFGISKTRIVSNAFGFGALRLTLEAGKTYVLRAAEPVAASDTCANSTAWVEREDHTPVTDKVRVRVVTGGGEAPVSGGPLPAQPDCPPG